MAQRAIDIGDPAGDGFETEAVQGQMMKALVPKPTIGADADYRMAIKRPFAVRRQILRQIVVHQRQRRLFGVRLRAEIEPLRRLYARRVGYQRETLHRLAVLRLKEPRLNRIRFGQPLTDRALQRRTIDCAVQFGVVRHGEAVAPQRDLVGDPDPRLRRNQRIIPILDLSIR